MKRVYYAHSVALYGTVREARDIADLERLGFEVVNPNNEAGQKGYAERGMEYFHEIVKTCDALAFRSNENGSINAGVFAEIVSAQNAVRRVVVFELPRNIDIYGRTLTIKQTRALLKSQGVR